MLEWSVYMTFIFWYFSYKYISIQRTFPKSQSLNAKPTFEISNHSLFLFWITNSIEKSKKVTLIKNNVEVTNSWFLSKMKMQA